MYGSRLATTTTRIPARRSLRRDTRRSRDHSAASALTASEGNHFSIACLNVRLIHPRGGGTGRRVLQESDPALIQPNLRRSGQSLPRPCPYPGQKPTRAVNEGYVRPQTGLAS